MVIVSGGGQIDDYWGGPMGHPYTLLKWGVLARTTGARFVVLSVGYCTLASRLSSLFVGKALQLAEYRSYRDLGSKNLLARFQFTHDDPVMPDLAFSYAERREAPDLVSTFPKVGSRIGISPIAYLLKGRWPKYDVAAFERYASNMVIFVTEILRRGHSVVLFSTDAQDQDVIELLMPRIETEVSPREMLDLCSAPVGCVRDLFDELDKLDLVVASRLHGVILSHICAKPVLAISYDRKVTHYMESVDQKQHCVDIHSILAHQLVDSFESLQKQQDASIRTVMGKTENFRASLKAQYNTVVNLIDEPVEHG